MSLHIIALFIILTTRVPSGGWTRRTGRHGLRAWLQNVLVKMAAGPRKRQDMLFLSINAVIEAVFTCHILNVMSPSRKCCQLKFAELDTSHRANAEFHSISGCGVPFFRNPTEVELARHFSQLELLRDSDRTSGASVP